MNRLHLLLIHVRSAYDSKNPFITRKCRDCGKEYVLYKSEVDFYNTHNLKLPKRCKACREKKKKTVNK